MLVTLQIFDDFVLDLPGFSSDHDVIGDCKGTVYHGHHVYGDLRRLKILGPLNAVEV